MGRPTKAQQQRKALSKLTVANQIADGRQPWLFTGSSKQQPVPKPNLRAQRDEARQRLLEQQQEHEQAAAELMEVQQHAAQLERQQQEHEQAAAELSEAQQHAALEAELSQQVIQLEGELAIVWELFKDQEKVSEASAEEATSALRHAADIQDAAELQLAQLELAMNIIKQNAAVAAHEAALQQHSTRRSYRN